ncbi:MAG: hypothetical protein WC926_03645 [Candidatus Paceibacterota bacterium]|jgi:hypothetical protein
MAIFDDLKSVGKVLQEAGKIEQYKQILEAQEKLLEMQKRVAELEEENKKLKELLACSEDLEFRISVYYKKSNGDGPFCPNCWDAYRKLIRVIKSYPSADSGKCPQCNNLFNIEGREPVYKPKFARRDLL